MGSQILHVLHSYFICLCMLLNQSHGNLLFIRAHSSACHSSKYSSPFLRPWLWRLHICLHIRIWLYICPLSHLYCNANNFISDDFNPGYYVLVSSAWSSPEAIHVAPGGLGTAAKNYHQHCHSHQHNYQESFPVDRLVLKLCLDSSTLSPPSVIPS